MNVEIINNPLDLHVYGFSATAIGRDYAGTALKLMDKMWKIVKSNNLPNKRINIWVYGPGEKVFAGVELEGTINAAVDLELKNITLDHYAYYKHIGPYALIKKVGQEMREELKEKGLEITTPYIERYGHWTNNQMKLETELLIALT